MTEPETLLQHATFLRGLARGLLGGSEEARDVVQQTWLAALEKGPRRPEKARAWLAVPGPERREREWGPGSLPIRRAVKVPTRVPH